jgi:colanic acid biosynthesis glycosyl transferase WcaI
MAPSKKVLLINQYFYPDMAATSQLLGDLASWMSSRDWEVMALTGRASYAGAESVSERRSGKVRPGVSVRRVWCTNFGRAYVIGRLCDYVTFLVLAAVSVAVSPRPDVVVCLSTPPFVAILGLIARLKGSRLVYKVEDLYPEVAVALGALGERSLLTLLLLRVSRFLLRKADSVVALDEAMSKRVREAGALSVETIPNWADGSAIRSDRTSGEAFRQSNRLKGRFIVLYSGNLGRAHRFDAVMEAAQRCLVEFPAVLFLFVGNGPRLCEVQKSASGMSNVRFMEYQPREQLNALYNAADLHLVTLRDEMQGLLFPCKYAAALAAGKPVLLVGGKGAPFAQEIRDRKLGWVCSHETSAVMDAITDALKNPAKRESMTRNARLVFEARYSRTMAMQSWERVLNAGLGAPTSGKAKSVARSA